MYYKADYLSPLGKITLASDGERLVGLWLPGQKAFLSGIKEELQVQEDLQVFDAAKGWLDRYFAGERPEALELPLAPAGSAFRQQVWKLLCDIPYGETTTYKAIAEKIAQIQNRPCMSAQAVGGAVGHNPISIIIPCHRVIGTDRSLTGYGGGIEIKQKLLELEGIKIKDNKCI